MSMQKFSFLSQKLWTCPPPPIYRVLTRDYPLYMIKVYSYNCQYNISIKYLYDDTIQIAPIVDLWNEMSVAH